MTAQRRPDLTRTLLGALIASDATEDQLEQLANDLRSGGSVASELAAQIERYIGKAKNQYEATSSSSAGKDHALTKTRSATADSLVRLILNNRIPKPQLLGHLSQNGASTEQIDSTGKASVRDIVTRYVRTASDQQITELWRWASGGKTEDPYLRGIESPK